MKDFFKIADKLLFKYTTNKSLSRINDKIIKTIQAEENTFLPLLP